MAKQKRMFKKKKSMRLNKAKFFGAMLLLFGVFVGVYFAYMFTGYKEASAEELVQDGRFAEGVKVNSVDIGGLNWNEAREKLDPVAFAKAENFKMTILLDNQKHIVKGDDINAYTNVEETLSQAIALGQTGNRWERKRELARIKREGAEFFLRYTYDNDLMEEQLEKIQDETGMAAQDATVKIDGGKITYIEGKTGIKIDKNKLDADIQTAMDQNLEQFDIQAQTVEVAPTVTVADLQARLVKKASTSTEFKSSSSSRVTNVVKAASKINGKMIPAGGTFSINAALGARTKENGWSVATAISGGKYIDDVGGGVCQVSSSLYVSALKSGLEIVERSKHTYPVSYLPAGQDATISTGGPDLKIRNPYDFPVY
ncbi:MAG: VanW family protein, partial [Clostridia bacterium]|nr:VanW family protein [Clostridia bacterium]